MAKRPTVRSTSVAKPGKLVHEKSADFRSIRADGSVPIGDPANVTIILTRTEPGVLIQTIGAVLSEKVAGIQNVSVTSSDVSPVHVQAAHVVLPHEMAAELGGNILRLIEALDGDLYKATLARFGLARASGKDAN